MIVVITDAPLHSRNLERVAKRAMLGLAKTGGIASNGSGDYVIALSVNEDNIKSLSLDSKLYQSTILKNEAMTPVFLATIEATEEAMIVESDPNQTDELVVDEKKEQETYEIHSGALEPKIRQRKGEIILLSLIALGEGGPGQAEPIVLKKVIHSMKIAGLNQEIRAIALEAAILGKPVITFGDCPYNLLPDTAVRRVKDLRKLHSTIFNLTKDFK